MASVGELFVSLGFDVDSKALDQFDQGIKNLSGNMLELLGISGVTAYGVNKFVTGAMDGAQTMISLAQGTRLASVELQNYSNVVAYMNKDITAGAAAANIAQLDARLNAVRQGFTGDTSIIYALGRIGANAKDMNMMQILDLMNQKFRSGEIKPTEQLSVLTAMGLAPQFLNALNAKPEQLANAHKAVDITAQQQKDLAESSRRLNEAFIRLETILERILASPLLKFVDDITGQTGKDYSALKNSTKDNEKILATHGVHLPDRYVPGNLAERMAFGFSESIKDWLGIKNKKDKGWSIDDVDHSGVTNKLFGYGAHIQDAIDKQKNDNQLPPSVSADVGDSLRGVGAKQIDKFLSLPPLKGDQYLPPLPPPPPYSGGASGTDYKTSNNVTIYNRGEVRPETWAAYTVQTHQNTIYQQNNAATA
jgi:hypothetical protein